MDKKKHDEELVDWVPEDGYGDESEEESTNTDDALEGIDQTESGC